MIRIALALLLLSGATAFLGAGATAQTVPPGSAPATPPVNETDDGRYIYNRVQDGFVRLDTRTGQVSLCGRRNIGWTCEAIPEERAALESEIARLQSDNATLKKELLSRGLPLPGTLKPDAQPPVAKNREPELKLPNSADIERMMSFVENVWRRMVEMIKNVQKDVFKKT
jgi:hypothetical protein